ncbi:MAG TPA: DUF882 domain-containing protein [Beijerinckiaceae bacterium]|nr:DUF882 domain-containing protein [Beijerinckiaceae bacterium]
MPRGVGRAVLGLVIAAAAVVSGTRGTQDANANGDNRTLTLFHTHRNESATITFKRNGRYDPEGLTQLNWFLRDWRSDETAKMEPRLFDIVWEVYREVGAREPIHILSAYRSPQTNAMLRRRSRGVSEHSLHMSGKAMDFRLPDADMGRVRAIAMRLQHGGVGYYPGSNFVHLDAGSVRAWPRMTYDQLARLFPDGKTVHLPANGKPFARYEEARAEIMSRGGAVTSYASVEAESTGRKSLWATLFGGDDEDTEFYRAQGRRGGPRSAAYAPAGSDEGRIVLARSSADAPAAEAAPSAGAPSPAPSAATLDLPGQTLGYAPMPPRRPDAMTVLTALMDAPLPPQRPVQVAAAGMLPLRSADVATTAAVNLAPRPGFAPDERAALRALFATVANDSKPLPRVQLPRVQVVTSRARPLPLAPGVMVADLGPTLNLRLSANPTGDLSTTRFTGPAVKFLTLVR